MRRLVQPGAEAAARIDSRRGEPHRLQFTLAPGVTLNEALTAPLVAAGFQSAAVTFYAAELNPFRYVVPAQADDARHVAWFSRPCGSTGISQVEWANATFGWADGKPLVHCHAVWREPGNQRRGGHILPHETMLARSAVAIAWGFTDIRIEAAADAETEFTLFQPAGVSMPKGGGIIVRIKPNQDILTALETVARRHGIVDAIVRGSLGSLIGARFTNGSRVDDLATEVLVREGIVQNGRAALDMLVVDMGGMVHEGWLKARENPVCITFEAMLEVASFQA